MKKTEEIDARIEYALFIQTIVAVVVGCAITWITISWLGLVLGFIVSMVLALIFNRISLWFTVQFMAFKLGKELSSKFGLEAQSKKVQDINDRLKDGSLTVESPELDSLMVDAGLRPLSILVEEGPQLGIQDEQPILEWVLAKTGVTGDTHKYSFVCKAPLDKNNVLNYPIEAEKDYVIVNGMLYERPL